MPTRPYDLDTAGSTNAAFLRFLEDNALLTGGDFIRNSREGLSAARTVRITGYASELREIAI